MNSEAKQLTEEQDNYIIRKLKYIKRKLFQAYLIPFFVDFGFRIGGAFLSGLVGEKSATIIGISLLTLTRIKAVKDLYDVVKGLIETEKLKYPTLTVKEMFIKDTNKIIKALFLKKQPERNDSETNAMSIILGAIAPMMFDYFSMGIVARYGATGALVTQVIDTLLHLSALLVLFSSIKNVNRQLQKFNTEYYSQFKSFISGSLQFKKSGVFSKNHTNKELKDILNKEKTKQNNEKIRRFLISTSDVVGTIKNSTDHKEWTQFYLQFPTDKDKAERSIRECDGKYMIVTKIVDQSNESNKLGYLDTSRDTYTVEIPRHKYDEFLKLNGESPIYNLICYSIPFENGVILLDVYKGMFEGLNIARVKFENDEASYKFKIPSWFGREITTDPDYSGRHFNYTKDRQ